MDVLKSQQRFTSLQRIAHPAAKGAANHPPVVHHKHGIRNIVLHCPLRHHLLLSVSTGSQDACYYVEDADSPQLNTASSIIIRRRKGCFQVPSSGRTS